MYLDGATGSTGAPGAPGLTGTPGTDGADGADGADGTPGTDGTDGADGAKGDPGSPGIPGRALLEGETGGIEINDYDLDSITLESDNSGPTKWPLDSSSSNPSPSVVRRK